MTYTPYESLEITAAAISALPQHAAVMLTSEGTYLASQCYEHEMQPEQP